MFFCFIKFYDLNMFRLLLWYVFVSYMVKYFFVNMLLWMRVLLVMLVWFGVLLYVMRNVWSMLFWFSDDGMVVFFFYKR